MKKRKLLVGLLAATTVLGLAACGGNNGGSSSNVTPSTSQTPAASSSNPTSTPGSSTKIDEKVSVTFNADNGSNNEVVAVNKGEKVSKPTADPTKENYLFAGWYNGATKFDFDSAVNESLTLKAKWVAVGNATLTFHNVDPYDESATTNIMIDLDQLDTDDSVFGSFEGTEPTNEYKTFAGYYLDAALTQEADLTKVKGDMDLYVKWDSKYETVTSGFDAVALGSVVSWANLVEATEFVDNSNSSKDITYGEFTFEAGCRIEVSKNDINTQGKKIYINLTGQTNAIHMGSGSWASSTAGFIKLDKMVNGEAVNIYTSGDGETKYASGDVFSSEDFENLEAGTYVLYGEKSVRFTSIKVDQMKELAPLKGIELLSKAVDQYLIGDSFNQVGLGINLVYQNNKKEAASLDDIDIDISAVDFTKAGTYTVTYTLIDSDFEPLTQEVKVFEPKELQLMMYSLSSARVTEPVQQIVLAGDNAALDSSKLGVMVLASLDDEDEVFALGASDFTVVAPDLSTAGDKTATVKYARNEEITATYNVLVVDKKLEGPSVEIRIGDYQVTEDIAYGVLNQNKAYVHNFAQAMQLVALSGLDEKVNINLIVKPGTYYEKVEFNAPNIQLVNAFLYDNPSLGSEIVTHKFKDEEKVTITFDRINGMTDTNGNVHSTDGSASVSVRSKARNFAAYGIRFENYYNTHELYEQSKLISSNTQAVALLVEADEAMFINCEMSSYHDTLYAREGRQLYYNCYIEGRTDYIFADRDVTALFEKCTIHTLGANQDKNGGYVTALKGSKVNYSYIFDNCKFEADLPEEVAVGDGLLKKVGVANGTVSLGRSWDAEMRLVIMNSTISAAYSKTDFGHGEPVEEGSNNLKNTRYTNMGNVAAPKAANIFEFNNTGDGALTPAEGAGYATVTVLESITDEVKDFVSNEVAVIFSSNGTKVYPNTWINNLFQALGLPFDIVTVTVSNPDGSLTATFNQYKNGHMTGDFIKDNFAQFPTFAKYNVTGFYKDAACTEEFDFTKPFVDATTIFVKLESKAKLVATVYTFDDLEIGDITAETKLGGNDSIVTLVATDSKKFAVDANAQKYTVEGLPEATSVNRLKTGGSSDATGRYIVIDLRDFEGTALLEVFVITASNGTARTGQVRIDAVDGESILVLDCPKREASDPIPNQKIVVDCGHLYYLTADASINYYALAVSPVSESVEPEFPSFYAGDAKLDPAYNGWEVYMAKAGSQDIATTLGYDKDKKDKDGTVNENVELVKSPKLAVGDYIQSPRFDDSNKVELSMISSSTGTGNPIAVVVELLTYDPEADAFTVVKSFEWQNVTAKKLSTLATCTIESEEVFNFIRINYATPTDKNFGILSVDGKLSNSAPVVAEKADITPFDATKAEEGYDGWTVTMAKTGSAKVATTLGYDKDKKDKDGTVNEAVELVDCPKLVGVSDTEGDTIKSAKFAAATKIELTMISSSTGTSDPISCYVDLLDENGMVVKTVVWDNTSAKKLSTEANLEVSSEEAFYFVQIRAGFKTGKTDSTNFNVLSINGVITLATEAAPSPTPVIPE